MNKVGERLKYLTVPAAPLRAHPGRTTLWAGKSTCMMAGVTALLRQREVSCEDSQPGMIEMRLRRPAVRDLMACGHAFSIFQASGCFSRRGALPVSEFFEAIRIPEEPSHLGLQKVLFGDGESAAVSDSVCEGSSLYREHFQRRPRRCAEAYEDSESGGRVLRKRRRNAASDRFTAAHSPLADPSGSLLLSLWESPLMTTERSAFVPVDSQETAIDGETSRCGDASAEAPTDAEDSRPPSPPPERTVWDEESRTASHHTYTERAE